MKQTNSENNKEKHNKENKKHTFEMKNKKHSKKAAQDDIMEDLEFISEESVKDKSRMAEGKPISHEFVSKRKPCDAAWTRWRQKGKIRGIHA